MGAGRGELLAPATSGPCLEKASSSVNKGTDLLRGGAAPPEAGVSPGSGREHQPHPCGPQMPTVMWDSEKGWLSLVAGLPLLLGLSPDFYHCPPPWGSGWEPPESTCSYKEPTVLHSPPTPLLMVRTPLESNAKDGISEKTSAKCC